MAGTSITAWKVAASSPGGIDALEAADVMAGARHDAAGAATSVVVEMRNRDEDYSHIPTREPSP